MQFVKVHKKKKLTISVLNCFIYALPIEIDWKILHVQMHILNANNYEELCLNQEQNKQEELAL